MIRLGRHIEFRQDGDWLTAWEIDPGEEDRQLARIRMDAIAETPDAADRFRALMVSIVAARIKPRDAA